ncbi:MAG: hypothetical protein M3M95_02735 [Pseudomonadota bacterium]|nr:hypothetical protein [Pseudomonadota bacterium]
MSHRIPPVSPVSGADPVRRGARMLVLRRRLESYAEGKAEPEDEAPPVAPERPTAAGVKAQLLDERPRRGLKGGPEVLEQARATYLQNEFSGRRDRRPRKGQITKTEV